MLALVSETRRRSPRRAQTAGDPGWKTGPKSGRWGVCVVKWRCESAASPAGGQVGDTWGCSDPAAGSGASGRQARRRLEGGCVPWRVRRAGKAASGPVAAVRHAGESAAAGVGAPRRVRRASGRPVGHVAAVRHAGAAVRHAGESAAAGVGASRRVRRASGAVAGVLRWHCGESGVPAGRAFRKLNKKTAPFVRRSPEYAGPGLGWST